MTEWAFIAWIVEEFKLPGLVIAGIGWAIYRFGLTPSHGAVMTTETASALKALSDRLDGYHTTAQGQREDVIARLVRLETRLEERRR